MLANMKLAVLLVALATSVSALPGLSEIQAEAGKISKRTSVQFVMSNFRESAAATRLSSVRSSRLVYDPSGQTCVLKFWSDADCKGTATTWWMKGAKNDRCFDSASQGGIRKLSGAKSVLANCAEDAIPAS
ncbi:hypothetical protein COL154_013538 [Colletotrichum chrysophilum]|uniref:Uncharacterized protein n=1 Tax=Colletotrichum chrysophilum TaxID=1836956 RepID=A0AAD9ABF0_9PEZI|nr:uncharacterized protein COL26b_009785 [Colletotrichum chrysophilum]KAJ0336826.1 hypothetical protein KNSL1_013142 [Colletotrichum chrysophilum]KAJ0349611.1 hypothetical protein COL154_013538 [Colletotrichum chrysophilum]KAJ0371077.1 hypothetical protein COL26b_009785 [Colletotrichum chrysophilum]KAK1842434.1 hypothetical protein CCHR01_14943 [Colletotrichum chrysophilum]